MEHPLEYPAAEVAGRAVHACASAGLRVRRASPAWHVRVTARAAVPLRMQRSMRAQHAWRREPQRADRATIFAVGLQIYCGPSLRMTAHQAIQYFQRRYHMVYPR
jgi:hypothetical protein